MFKNGERVFLPGASGEPGGLAGQVLATAGIEVTTSFVPGVNMFPAGWLETGARCTGFFMQPALTQAQRAGRYRHLPLSYAAAVAYFEAQPPFDACLVQLSPPDAAGRCSLGPAAEFTPAILRRARRVIAVINPNVPRLPHAPTWRLTDCAEVMETDTNLTAYDPGAPDAASESIAAHVASLVRDGATLQFGLGRVPTALYAKLGGHRGLKFHSGMLSDGIMALAAQGALAAGHIHKTTVILGTAALYDWAAGRADIAVTGCENIHLPRVLAGIEGLVAINSALEVDLFGQCNLELANGRAVSSAGGAPDFAHAARRSPGGLSIIALPASFGGGKASRIVPSLGPDTLTSLPRTDVDIVVTEDGIADLRHKSVYERAESLIEVAAPGFRADLRAAWAAIEKRL